MSPVGFEPTISAGERLKTYALERAATGAGNLRIFSDLKGKFRNGRMIYEWVIKRHHKFTDSTQCVEPINPSDLIKYPLCSSLNHSQQLDTYSVVQLYKQKTMEGKYMEGSLQGSTPDIV
jgi:hypothetical protein